VSFQARIVLSVYLGVVHERGSFTAVLLDAQLNVRSPCQRAAAGVSSAGRE